jgi:uncharacterized protein YkwD
MTAKIKSHQNYTKTSHKHKPKGVSGHSFEKVYWPYIPLLIIASLIVSLSAYSGHLERSFEAQFTHNVLAYATSLSPQDLLNDTNQDRAANGKAPLKINSLLTKAAQAKANDMALRNYWSHNTPAGNPPWVFVTATNYQYDKLGENLAAGFSDSMTTINGWMASPEHKANMLDSAYSEVGFGFANNPNYTSTGNDGPMTIVVAFYGQPAVASVSLDKQNTIALAAASKNLSSGPPSATNVAHITLASFPYSNYAAAGLIALLSAGVGLWLGRHFFALKRRLFNGERYVRAHPLFDLGVVVIIVAIWTLTQTVGFIQ